MLTYQILTGSTPWSQPRLYVNCDERELSYEVYPSLMAASVEREAIRLATFYDLNRLDVQDVLSVARDELMDRDIITEEMSETASFTVPF